MKIPQVVLLVYMVYSVHAQIEYPYNCHVDGGCDTVTDAGAICEASNKLCTCSGTVTHHRCATGADVGANDNTCDPDFCTVGTDPGENAYACAGSKCICNQGYMNDGDTKCSKERVEVTCNTLGATVTVTHYNTAFGGAMYFTSPSGDIMLIPTCALTCTDEVCTSNTDVLYDGTFPDNTCPEITPTGSPANIHTMRLFIQQQPGIISDADLLLTIQCQPGDAANPVIITADTPYMTNDIAAAATGAVTRYLGLGLTASLFVGDHESTAGVTTAVPSGTELTVKVSSTVVADGAVYSDMSMKAVTITNENPDGSTTSIQRFILAADWCIPSTARGIVTGVSKPATYDSPYVISISFKTFAFLTLPNGDTNANPTSTDPATFYVIITICPGACTRSGGACTAPSVLDFDDLTTAVSTGRKKRQAPADEEEIDLHLYFSSTGSFQQNYTRTNEMMPHSADCYTTLAFILPLVMMAILLLFALIMVYVFFTKLSQARNGGMNGETNMAYKS